MVSGVANFHSRAYNASEPTLSLDIGGNALQDFEYVVPKTLKDAIGWMAGKGSKAKALAGGTDVLVQLRGGRFTIDRLVELKNVPEMNEVTCSRDKGLILGAAVPCYRVYDDKTIQELYPGLVDAAFLIGGIQIQGRATIGGNLCNSSPSGDTIPALIALNAQCNIEGPNGVRTVSVEEFCTGPGSNLLQDGELLVSLSFPPPTPRSGAHFLRFIPRNEMDIAVANTAAWVQLGSDREHIEAARISIGAVAPTPLFAKAASDILSGRVADEDSYQAAAEAAQAIASPIDDMRGTVRQRIHLVGVLTKRALRQAVARAKEA